MKKQLIVASIVASVSAASIAGVGIANAATTTSSANGPMAGLVDAIASKFNLQKADVQAVVDAQKTKMEAEREANVQAAVTQLVKDGTLTQAQADKINAKRAELQKQRETDRATNQSLSEADRKTKQEKERTDLETWAKDNGIANEYLRYVNAGGHGHGGPGFGNNTSAAKTTPN